MTVRQCLLRRSHRQLGFAVHQLQRFAQLLAQVSRQIAEVADASLKFRDRAAAVWSRVARVVVHQTRDPAPSGDQRLPELRDPAADRTDNPNAGNHDATRESVRRHPNCHGLTGHVGSIGLPAGSTPKGGGRYHAAPDLKRPISPPKIADICRKTCRIRSRPRLRKVLNGRRSPMCGRTLRPTFPGFSGGASKTRRCFRSVSIRTTLAETTLGLTGELESGQRVPGTGASGNVLRVVHPQSRTQAGAKTVEIINIRSDTQTLPTEAMYEAMTSAPLGDDTYDEDPTVEKFEKLAAEKMGTEAAMLVISGNMGNLAAMMTHAQPGDEVLLDLDSHILFYEAGRDGECRRTDADAGAKPQRHDRPR